MIINIKPGGVQTVVPGGGVVGVTSSSPVVVVSNPVVVVSNPLVVVSNPVVVVTEGVVVVGSPPHDIQLESMLLRHHSNLAGLSKRIQTCAK